MPPRYAYWTILVDGQPTAFRSGALEDIMPTFNRLKEKQPTAELKWFQNGQLWPSRHDAQDFMRARGDRGRERDPRQSSASTRATADKSDDRAKPAFAKATEGKPERAWNAKPEWKTRSSFSPRSKPGGVASGVSRSSKPMGDKPEWKPKGSFTPSDDKPAWKPKSASARASFGDRDDRPAGQARSDRKPEWKPKGTFKPKEAGHASGWGEKPSYGKTTAFGRATADKPEGRPAWKSKPSGSARDQARSSFRPKSYTPKSDDGMTRSSRVQSRDDKLEWKPASAKGVARPDGPNAGFAKSDPDAPKRKWVPKAEYKKSLGIEAKRDDKWRPGGEHKDPKQKYKDAKKAKWTRVKATIRARSTKPRKPKDE